MATQNSINKKSESLTLDPGASGDSFVQFDINGTSEFRIGVDDTASDAFKISQGSALGTNDVLVATAAGEITQPLQPAFLAVLASTISNVTGDGTLYTIVWDTEVFDQNSDFDGTSTFTAPVTGRYEISMAVTVGDLGAAHTDGYSLIYTSNRSYLPHQANYAAYRDSSNIVSLSFSILCDMDAADTANIEILISNGTKIVDIVSNGATDPYNWFSAVLVS